MAESIDYHGTTWLRRVRSTVLLLLLVVVLGALTAAVVGVGGVAFTTLVDHALE